MVKLIDVSRLYSKNGQVIKALDGVNLEVTPGDFLSIVGPSGSGKTTLMNILGYLDSPTSGRYLLDGRELPGIKGKKAAQARNRSIGFIFQGFNLIHGLSALENTELPLTLRGVPKAARRERAMEALNHVGLSDRAHHRPAELSGGQQQRVAIARVLAGEPQLILADEPTGNLDGRSSREIIATLGALNALGRTVIMITHDTSAAAAAAHTMYMRNGQLSNQ